jgi:hypothetical protein
MRIQQAKPLFAWNCLEDGPRALQRVRGKVALFSQVARHLKQLSSRLGERP